MAKINIDELANEILRFSEIYQANTMEGIAKAVKQVAKETAAELRKTSPVGATGDYSKSWSYRRDPHRGKTRYKMVVYSKRPQYRKTHLLEHGHKNADTGRFVPARPHIKMVEVKASNRLFKLLVQNLEDAAEYENW